MRENFNQLYDSFSEKIRQETINEVMDYLIISFLFKTSEETDFDILKKVAKKIGYQYPLNDLKNQENNK